MSADVGADSGSVFGGRQWVIGVVATWLVGGILAFRDAVAGLILVSFDATGTAFRDAGSEILDGLGTAGAVPINLLAAAESGAVELASAAGPFGFVVFPALGMATVVVLIWLARFAMARIGGIFPLW